MNLTYPLQLLQCCPLSRFHVPSCNDFLNTSCNRHADHVFCKEVHWLWRYLLIWNSYKYVLSKFTPSTKVIKNTLGIERECVKSLSTKIMLTSFRGQRLDIKGKIFDTEKHISPDTESSTYETKKSTRDTNAFNFILDSPPKVDRI